MSLKKEIDKNIVIIHREFPGMKQKCVVAHATKHAIDKIITDNNKRRLQQGARQ